MKLAFLLAGCCLAFPSCALIFTGTTDTVTVTSDPSNQKVTIDGFPYRTPAMVELSSDDTHTVTGPDGNTRLIASRFDPVTICDLLFIVPWIVDLASGAAFKLSPRDVHFFADDGSEAVTSKPQAMSSIPSPAR